VSCERGAPVKVYLAHKKHRPTAGSWGGGRSPTSEVPLQSGDCTGLRTASEELCTNFWLPRILKTPAGVLN
jgi:hypothetical protein